MSSPNPDYKSTLHLPQTEFPMKGNLPAREPEFLRMWDEKSIYERMVAKNDGKKKFIMPDGPPYANAPIHIGHALNKVLKDIIIKYRNMAGLSAPYIPGWDCHGLPIEHKVMKDLMEKKVTKTDDEIRGLCRAEAAKWVDIQQAQFQRLGVFGDWKNRYLTMDASYEAEEVRELARALKKGVMYRDVKPVYWNWTLQTALADAEIEYHMHKSPSVYVKFNITDAATLAKLGSPKKPTSLVIWTTTPWTLPANLGISLHPNFDYAVYDTGSENLVLAKGLKEAVEKETGLQLTEGFNFKGSDLDKMKARHPFIDRDSLIMNGEHVTLEAGTGAVHTAPGHGTDDYKVGLAYGLPVYSPVDGTAKYTDEVPEYKGIHIFKANPMIVERLKQSGHLLAYKDVEHSYPHCWRTKTPLIFRATPQWFIGLDVTKDGIRAKALKAIKEIQFFPKWGEARLQAMMENRPDWCISRQRIWGVPIPIFYCIETDEALVDHDVMMKVADAIDKGGIDAYHNLPVETFVGPEHVKGKFGSKGFRRGRDILDVWFDSGVCHAAVQKRRGNMGFPADIYLEGSDQHRGWFNTSLLSSIATNDVPPFKALITHGFVNDSEGKKMSKSKGNSVDPQEVSGKSGAEIIRLWTVYEDYGQDLTCGPSELERVTETYRRIRNTMRYLLGATYDFDPKKDVVAYEKMTELDQWILHRLSELIADVTKAYETYEFYKIYHALNHFFTVELSATYLDSIKDRIYTGKTTGNARRSSQTALWILTDNLIRLMAPVLSFLAEEVYQNTKSKSEDSVFLHDFPVADQKWSRPDLATKFAEILRVRAETSKVLEGLRQEKTIGASLEAQLTLTAEGEAYKSLKAYESGLREFFIVSDFKLKEGQFRIEATKAPGEKCVRCWHYSLETGKNSQFAEVCPKCVEALS